MGTSGRDHDVSGARRSGDSLVWSRGPAHATGRGGWIRRGGAAAAPRSRLVRDAGFALIGLASLGLITFTFLPRTTGPRAPDGQRLRGRPSQRHARTERDTRTECDGRAERDADGKLDTGRS